HDAGRPPKPFRDASAHTRHDESVALLSAIRSPLFLTRSLGWRDLRFEPAFLKGRPVGTVGASARRGSRQSFANAFPRRQRRWIHELSKMGDPRLYSLGRRYGAGPVPHFRLLES